MNALGRSPKKKVRSSHVSASVDVLHHCLGNIGHVVEVDLQKKCHQSFIEEFMDVLPHGLGNFGHDHPLEKFDVS